MLDKQRPTQAFAPNENLLLLGHFLYQKKH